LNTPNTQIEALTRSFFALAREIDLTFDSLRSRYSEEVRCGKGCDDCCYAAFSVSYVEAWVIKQELAKRMADDATLLLRLQKRAIDYDLGKQAKERDDQLSAKEGNSQMLLAQWRIRCPMLEDAQQCAIYEVRPLTCRIYGLPLSIEGKGHVCGFSGFKKGRDYPTIKMENIHAYLLDLSSQLARLTAMPAGRANRRYFLSEIISSLLAE